MSGPRPVAAASSLALLAALLVAAAGAAGAATDAFGRAALAALSTGTALLAWALLRRGPARPCVTAAEGVALGLALFAAATAAAWPDAIARALAPLAWGSRSEGLGTAGGVRPSLDAGATWRAALLVAGLAWLAVAARAAVAGGGLVNLLRLLSFVGLAHATAALVRGRYLEDERLLFGLRVDSSLVAYGTFPNRAEFAGFTLLLLGAAVGLLARSRRALDRALAVATLLVGAAGVVGSGSRAGMAGLFLGAATALVCAAPAGRRRRRLLAASAPLVAVVVARLAHLAPLVRLLPVRGDEDRRLEIWRGSLALALRQPATGIGLDAFRWAYPGEGRGPASAWPSVAENDVLQWLAETGIVGTALAAMFVALVARGLLRARRERHGDGVPVAVALAGFSGLVPLVLSSFPLHVPAVAAAAVLCWAAAKGLVRGGDDPAAPGYRWASNLEAPWPAS